MAASPQTGSLYDVLEVNANASSEDIQSSYVRLTSYLGADSLAVYSMVDEEQLARMRTEIEEAYRTLSNPERRAAYDRHLHGGERDGYPTVVVPEPHQGASVSLGEVRPRAQSPQVEPPGRDSVAAPSTALRPVAAESTSAPGVAQRASLPGHAAGGAVPATAGAPDADKGAVGRPRGRLDPVVVLALSPETEYSGAMLRRLRESTGASLDEVAETTKINKRYLRALEEQDYDVLPAPVYVRGFVSEYARALGLNPKRAADSYMSIFRRSTTVGGS